jgi:TPR repeat protein
MRAVAIALLCACACGRPRWHVDRVPVAQSMFLLGNRYRGADDARALALYRAAAERGHAAALETLSLAYAHGELGLARDDDEARRYAMEAEDALAERR